jgi:hypothetical protein
MTRVEREDREMWNAWRRLCGDQADSEAMRPQTKELPTTPTSRSSSRAMFEATPLYAIREPNVYGAPFPNFIGHKTEALRGSGMGGRLPGHCPPCEWVREEGGARAPHCSVEGRVSVLSPGSGSLAVGLVCVSPLASTGLPSPC